MLLFLFEPFLIINIWRNHGYLFCQKYYILFDYNNKHVFDSYRHMVLILHKNVSYLEYFYCM